MLRRVWRGILLRFKTAALCAAVAPHYKKVPAQRAQSAKYYITALGRYSPLTVAFCFIISMISRSFSVSAE